MRAQIPFDIWSDDNKTHFRAWAPRSQSLEVVIFGSDQGKTYHPMRRREDGIFTAALPRLAPGTRYKYRLDRSQEFPDPASRFQPDGVHGPSMVVDSTAYAWGDGDWKGRPLDDMVIYELHVGTFTPEGTFSAAAGQLQRLVDLGVTAIELMPLADFPGQRNWGYDGVCLYAPARCYGKPDDLRALVDRAHRLDLAAILDVVYNHFGPDGNYLAAFTPYWVNPEHESPWGPAINLDGEYSDQMRRLFIDNAIYWLKEFHFDGLRLDATHAMRDDRPRHFLAELAQSVHEAITSRPVTLIAEDHRNLAKIVLPHERGGWDLDAIWADDFHHEMRRLLVGDCEGYFQDYCGRAADVARIIDQGWLYCGQSSRYQGKPRGTCPTDLSPSAFVICLQNHDQIGNRALGERLNHQVEPATYRAATCLLLCAPETPLLFMGQEWAASTPFLFFTDHHEELGRQVTAGRRREFRHFAAFADEEHGSRIPDPQAESTFLASKLNWSECTQPLHARVWNLHQVLLHLRQSEPALHHSRRGRFKAAAADTSTVVVQRQAHGSEVLLVCRLKGAGRVNLEAFVSSHGGAGQWDVLLTTEEPRFAVDPQPPSVELSGSQPSVQFHRPGAVLLKR